MRYNLDMVTPNSLGLVHAVTESVMTGDFCFCWALTHELGV